MSATNPQIATFSHYTASGINRPLQDFIDGIKSGKWAEPLGKMRSFLKGSADFEKLKKRLPCCMLSCTTNGGKRLDDVAAHSGLLQLDIDGVGAENAANLRDRIGEDRHMLAAWISPSGTGVKGILRIPADPARHKAAFGAAAEYMREKYGVTVDPACSNLNRLCYVSHDPDLVANLDAEPLEVAACSEGGDSSTILNLHVTSTDYVLHNTEIIRDFPNLEPLYQKLIGRRFPQPSRGTRNQTIVEIVPVCFYAFSSELVPGLAEAFFKQHEQAFGDYDFATYQCEVRSVLAGCQRSYLERLTDAEKTAYDGLSGEKHRDAFRIAQSLAKCESDDTVPPPLFHLSYEQLAARLGLYAPMQAKRILLAFIEAGIVEMVKKGTARAKGVQGVATVYRWML